MTLTQAHIYDAVKSWVTYALGLDLTLCPPYVHYEMLRQWMKEVSQTEFNQALRELVDKRELKIHITGNIKNPCITLPEISDEQILGIKNNEMQ